MTVAAGTALLTACLNDDTTGAGFSGISSSATYANMPYGYVSFASLGDWKMTQNSGNDWCSMDCMQGEGNNIYYIPARLSQNTTGSARNASFTLNDVNESDAYSSFYIRQYATRGDGTMGYASLVSKVEGDDGSMIDVEYDELCRPKSLKMTKDGNTLRELYINYSSTDSLISVTSGTTTLTSAYNEAYQPGTLTSETDTVGYVSQYSLNNVIAFNVEERRAGGEYTVQALKLVNQSLAADNEHVADSLRYLHTYTDGTKYTEKLGLTYSDKSNRCQSLDVNQLLLGIEECNPYVLLSLYKNARNSKVISEATDEDGGQFVIASTHNSDGSVKTMSVTDKTGRNITYTFSYQ